MSPARVHVRAARLAALLTGAVLVAGLWACDGRLSAGAAGTPPDAARSGSRESVLRPAAVPHGADDDQAQHERGRKVYNFRCYFCHGYSGDARTLAATYLTPPPRDFTAQAARALDRRTIAATLREGRAGTAMASFAKVIDARAIDDVSAFVEREFIQRRARNTAYHTAENGWPNHDRYRDAFAFAQGEVALDTPAENLSAVQLRGRALFMGSCVTCHDRARVRDEGPAWAARPVSYPRGGFEPADVSAAPPASVDAVSSASVYAKHEVVPRLVGLSAREKRGERLFQANCAFCHAADGTGKNWIGQFMEPKARDLTTFDATTLPPQRLRHVIREGLPDTSMPAWKDVLTARDVQDLVAYVQRAFLRKDAR